MKLRIAIVVFSSAAVVSCQVTPTALLDLQETNPTAIAITPSDPSSAPTSAFVTTVPPIGTSFQVESLGGELNVVLGDTRLSINLDPLNEIDHAGVIVTILSQEDLYLLEIFDPQERYLPAVRFFEKTGETQQDLDIHLPPANLGSVIFNDGAVQLEDLELEKIISIPINEMQDTDPWLRESYAATVLFPRYGDSSQFDNVDIYRFRNAQALYVVLPSDTLVARVGKLGAPAKLIIPPMMLIPIGFVVWNWDSISSYIIGFIEEHEGEYDLMTMISPDSLTFDDPQGEKAFESLCTDPLGRSPPLPCFVIEPVSGLTPEAASPTTTGTLTYVVAEGDTLASIAVKYGVTIDELIAANNHVDPYNIGVGSHLIIPAQPAPSPTQSLGSVEITFPEEGVVYSSADGLVGFGVEWIPASGAASYELIAEFSDGARYGGETVSAPTCCYRYWELPAANWIIRVEAVDTNGNVFAADSVSFSVSQQSP